MESEVGPKSPGEVSGRLLNRPPGPSCSRHVLKPGKPEHPGTPRITGTLQNTLEHRKSLKTLVHRTKFDGVALFLITDHVKYELSL